MEIIYRTVLIFLPLILIISSTSLSRAQIEKSDYPVPYKSITTEVESTTNRTVLIAMRHIAQARADIHRKALASARRDVAKAALLIESIRDDLSTEPAKNLIRIALQHLEYEKPEKVLRDLPPIYASLEASSIYLPTDKAKRHLDLAKDYLGKNSKLDAERELSLADKSLIIVEVELPLLTVQQYVTKAQKYLAANKAAKADKALQVAEQRAMALYTGINSPVFKAKQLSWWAFRNYSAVKHAETGKNLAQARNFLNRAATSGSTKLKEEAGKLSAELGEVEKKLAGEGKVAESTLKAAWEKSKALAERSAAYLSASLSEAETTLGIESYLIEAKLHVAYAETYQMTTLEPDKAVKELDSAYSYLQKAIGSSLAGPAERKKLREISNVLVVLKLTPKENDTTVQDRYDTVNEELSNFLVNKKSFKEIQELRDM